MEGAETYLEGEILTEGRVERTKVSRQWQNQIEKGGEDGYPGASGETREWEPGSKSQGSL